MGKLSKSIREQISDREDMPKSAFLVPSEKKYPVKKEDPKTGKWVYDVNMVLAAERRAILNKDTAIASKAKALRKKLTGE